MKALAILVFCAAPLCGVSNGTAAPSDVQHSIAQSAKLCSLYETPSQEPSLGSLGDFAANLQVPRFGEGGSWRWHVSAGAAVDVKTSRNRLYQGGVGVSYFIVENLSLDAELNAIYFDQIGDDAVGANLNLSFRYHLIARDRWSFYGDAGAGMLGTTDRVPEGGSYFNFVPHAGLGVSFDVGSNTRLMTGVRWHHISNANTYRRNPGRDSVLVYAALSFPF